MEKYWIERCTAEISLDNISRNFLRISAIIGGRKLIAVVKANAYGHGAVRVAERLFGDGCRSFAVATVDEAVELRESGLLGEIIILGYTPTRHIAELTAYGLTQTVFDVGYAKELSTVAENRNETLASYVTIDCGMGRLGIPLKNQLDESIKEILAMRSIDVKGIFAHPPCVEDRAVTTAQTDATLMRIQKFGLPVYAMNGLGAELYPEYRLSGARAGLSLYGYNDGFLPSMRLKARVVSVKTLEKGDTVGYGGTYRAKKRVRVAVVSAGYADGYPRAMSNAGFAEILGKRVRVIGSVTMDMTMLDVTGIGVETGDIVTLLGGNLSDSFAECAKKAGTITYEILTGISSRVRRIYI